jgi:hypothetical protein
MIILNSGEDQNIPMFPQSLVNALRGLGHNEMKFQTIELNGSVVWGQVLYDGKPLAGVTVRLLNNSENNPIYLNGWLPDHNLTETTKSGHFYFTEIPQGMQTVIVERSGQYIGHLNIEVDRDTTTVAPIYLSSKQKAVNLRVFDIFSGSEIQAEVKIQSKPESVIVDGGAQIQLPHLGRLSYGYVENVNEEYVQAQFSYFDDDDYIHVPLIKKQQLSNFAMLSKISEIPDTGIIVGVVPNDDFEVYLSHEESFDRSNIIYFDVTGSVSEKGKMGGGFIIFNVPVKTQSVTVISNQTGALVSKLIPVESNTTSILKLHF